MEKLKKQHLFPTTIYHTTVEDLDVDFYLKSLYEYKTEFPEGVKKSNIEGYQTEDNLHFYSTFYPLANKLNYILSENFECPCNIVSLWGNISPPKSLNMVHIHPGCDFAGVLYLDTPPNSGDILFYDFSKKDRLVRHKPIPKKLIIFPWDLYHSVELNLSNQYRISLSFNIHLQK